MLDGRRLVPGQRRETVTAHAALDVALPPRILDLDPQPPATR